MSANLYIVPKSSRIQIQTGSPQRVMEALRKAFGHFPATLSHGDLPVLGGMAAVDPAVKIWEDLIAAVEKYDTITIEAEY